MNITLLLPVGNARRETKIPLELKHHLVLTKSLNKKFKIDTASIDELTVLSQETLQEIILATYVFSVLQEAIIKKQIAVLPGLEKVLQNGEGA